MIIIKLRIKVRAFFTDLLKIERVFEVKLGVPLPPMSQKLMDERGVRLEIETR